MGWRTFAAGLDAGTAVCAALNTAYFLGRLHEERRRSRVAAVGVLAVISLGALLEATVLLASADDAGPALDSGGWAALRLLAFAGAAGVSALIARRMASR
jgi:hypothetical protein